VRLFTPTTLEELLALKAEHGTDALLIAGGTDLGVRLRRHPHRPAALICTGAVDSLDFVERPPSAGVPRADRSDTGPQGTTHGGAITLGIRATHRTVERLGGAHSRLRGLADACRTIGSVQTRNVGTVVGNIANASPAADAVTTLSALGATVRLESATGLRVVPVGDFATGPGRTVLGPHEVIAHVEVPAAHGRCGAAFRKLGRRRAMEISIVAAAGGVQLDDQGAVVSASLALGAVGPTVVAVPEAAEILHGQSFGGPNAQRALDEVAEAATRAARPRSDHRASAAYRREMTRLLTKRVLLEAWERALHQSDSHG
jgi:aerobic carbon-monoxide dehydrogenase medium subunit